MHTFPITFTGPQNFAKELQLNSVDPSIHTSTPEENFAFTQGSKPRILAADYHPTDIRTIAGNCTHLTAHQREQLHSVLQNHTSMFEGILRHYPDEPVHLDVNKSIAPHRYRAYPIP